MRSNDISVTYVRNNVCWYFCTDVVNPVNGLMRSNDISVVYVNHNEWCGICVGM